MSKLLDLIDLFLAIMFVGLSTYAFFDQQYEHALLYLIFAIAYAWMYKDHTLNRRNL